MARNEQTPEMFEAIADDLASGAEALRALAKLMRDGGMPSALIHGTTSQNRYVPAVLDWIEKTGADVKVQLRSHIAGVQSYAAKRKQYNENQKLAAAKKPWAKKAVKKKAT